MKVLGFRLCTVSTEAPKLASFLDAIGFERHPLEGGARNADGPFTGAVFAAGESWLAMWPPSADMPTGLMLQVVVDDADAFAAHAREQGLSPVGPTDSQNKRLYFLQAPTGLQISIQSRLPGRREESLPAPAVQESFTAAAQQGFSGPPPAPARSKNVSAPPLAARGVASPPPAAAAHTQNPAPPATAKRTIQTVVLPAPAPSRNWSAAPPPPALGRARGPAARTPAAGGARNNGAPPPPPIVARRAPR